MDNGKINERLNKIDELMNQQEWMCHWHIFLLMCCQSITQTNHQPKL